MKITKTLIRKDTKIIDVLKDLGDVSCGPKMQDFDHATVPIRFINFNDEYLELAYDVQVFAKIDKTDTNQS